MKVIVKAGTLTWTNRGDPSTVRFKKATPVTVEPAGKEWYRSIGPIQGIGQQVFLTKDMFNEVPRKGHYEALGHIWDEGEVPECSSCGEQATRVTPVRNFYLCDGQECWNDFISTETNEITFMDGGD